MKTTFTEPKVIVSAQIDRAAREELERRAAEADRTVSWLVRAAVASYLETSPSFSSGEPRASTSASVAGVS
ncbi:MAG: ribbon-helix-helix protein, CopG family [Actinobacteria bacterium]|nr:ribbon-helix-helix protein, CopG family [Actinomycetota bacterium]